MDKSIDLSLLTPEEYLFYIQYKYADKLYLHAIMEMESSSPIDKFEQEGKLDELLSAYMSQDEIVQYKNNELFELKNEIKTTKVPTTIENAMWYSVLKDLSKDVFAAARIMNCNLLEYDVALGTLPTGNINACVLPVPTGGLIVILNQGLFTFANLMAKAVAVFFPLLDKDGDGVSFSTDEKLIDDRINSNDDGHEKFIDACAAYFATSEPAAATPYILKSKQCFISDILRHSSELFVVAHEYAHIFLKHFSSNKTIKQKFFTEDIDEDCCYTEWNEEIEADLLGCQIALVHNLTHGLDPALSYFGIEFFLSCMSILEDGLHINTFETHPPSYLRRQILREMIKTEFSLHADSMLLLGNCINSLILKLWDRNKIEILKRAKLDNYY